MEKDSRKYQGLIFDGCWECVNQYRAHKKSSTYKYVLRNIFNGREIEVCSHTILKLEQKKTHVSKIIKSRIRTERSW